MGDEGQNKMTMMMLWEEMVRGKRKMGKMWETVRTEQKEEFTGDGLGMERKKIVNRDEKERRGERRQISCC